MPTKPPPPPSRIEPLTFPVFGMSWYADPYDGRSIVAYTGGGGSARTGVFNSIVVQDNSVNDESISISTGDKVGVAVCVYKNPTSNTIFMIVAMDKEVCRYIMPPPPVKDGEKYSQINSDSLNNNGESCNAIAVNIMADLLAVGCDNGLIHLYEISDDIPFASIMQPVKILQGHTETVCSLSFSLRNNLLVSSAKDGTARVWDCNPSNDDNYGMCMTTLVCPVDVDPKAPKPRTPPKILVRGCAFADIDGNVVLTCASARKGKAFLSKWIRKQQPQETTEQQQSNGSSNCIYDCIQRLDCSSVPISSMSLSDDGLLLALGSVSGSVILFDVQEWKTLRSWNEIHDLPVTCIAARPYRIPLFYYGEEELNEITIHARSASADSKLGCLSLQRKVPKKHGDNSNHHSTTMTIGQYAKSITQMIHRLFFLLIFLFICYPIFHDVKIKCHDQWHDALYHIQQKQLVLEPFYTCLMNEVIIAPSSKPGVKFPLY